MFQRKKNKLGILRNIKTNFTGYYLELDILRKKKKILFPIFSVIKISFSSKGQQGVFYAWAIDSSKVSNTINYKMFIIFLYLVLCPYRAWKMSYITGSRPFSSQILLETFTKYILVLPQLRNQINIYIYKLNIKLFIRLTWRFLGVIYEESLSFFNAIFMICYFNIYILILVIDCFRELYFD